MIDYVGSSFLPAPMLWAPDALVCPTYLFLLLRQVLCRVRNRGRNV